MQYTVQKVIRREIRIRAGEDRREGSGNAAIRQRILELARELKGEITEARREARSR